MKKESTTRIQFISESEMLTFVNPELKFKRKITINKQTGKVTILDIDTVNNKVVNKIICDVFELDVFTPKDDE